MKIFIQSMENHSIEQKITITRLKHITIIKEYRSLRENKNKYDLNIIFLVLVLNVLLAQW